MIILSQKMVFVFLLRQACLCYAMLCLLCLPYIQGGEEEEERLFLFF